MYSCLELKNNSVLTSFKDQLPCAFISSAKQMFHIQKTSHSYPLQGFAEEVTLNIILPH